MKVFLEYLERYIHLTDIEASTLLPRLKYRSFWIVSYFWTNNNSGSANPFQLAPNTKKPNISCFSVLSLVTI